MACQFRIDDRDPGRPDRASENRECARAARGRDVVGEFALVSERKDAEFDRLLVLRGRAEHIRCLQAQRGRDSVAEHAERCPVPDTAAAGDAPVPPSGRSIGWKCETVGTRVAAATMADSPIWNSRA